MANALWFGGRAEEAAATRDAALALVTPASGFVTAEVVHIFAAVLSLDLDDVDGFRRCADRFVQHPERVGVHRIVADGYLGYLDVLDGRADRGLAALRTSIDRCGDRNPAPGVRPLLLRLLVGACGVAGDGATGLAAADRALALGGTRLWDAEVRRQRARFLATHRSAPA
jgi:hypothetical protein